MRKTIISLCILALAGASAYAQGAYEALLFGENNYLGTARSAAMGNAFTALGGDLGSVGINPAGSAVNGYSQVTFTPGLSIYGSSTSYDGAGVNRDSRVRGSFPNVGAMLNFNTHRTSGLKRVSFGFVMNATSIYTRDFTGMGSTDRSSYMGYLADYATRYNIPASELNGNISNMQYMSDWPAGLGYQSGMVNEATGIAGPPYLSPVQDNIGGTYPMRGAIDQTYGIFDKGRKFDMVFNLGFDISDVLFFGANLGIIGLNLTRNEYLRETAVNPADFPVLTEGLPDQFQGMKFSYDYRASGAGIYGKFGLIVRPFDGLRIGAAIQTPTATDIRERRWMDASVTFRDADGKASSPDYDYEYRLRTPARYNFGIAYTIGSAGLISLDYELTNFGKSRYRELHSNDNSGWTDANSDIQKALYTAHYIRVGAEFKPIANFALRAGYNLAMTPQVSTYGFGGFMAGYAQDRAKTNIVSFGLGYSSNSSFFCDFALRCKINPEEFYYPYESYASAVSPEFSVRSRLWDALLTIGFRF
ncbi:MAG: hypothetical protein IJ795_07165 [Bacteroidales bacterium]|nr:hypothetical protein [Bacteroidales bacterium]